MKTSAPLGEALPAGALFAAVAVVGVQAVVLLVLGVFLAVAPSFKDVTDLGTAEAAAGLAVLGGLALGWFARGLRAARRWARSPVVLFQLLAAPVAVGLLQAGRWAYGVPLLLSAVLVLVLLSQPGARTPFGER